MTINEAMKKYRLPNPTTPEDLECQMEQGLNLRGQDSDGRAFLQRDEQALLLRRGIRVPYR